ncbi:MAG: hypothetical protein ABEI74_04245 [Candidatus Pacearchaeota archaeon]
MSKRGQVTIFIIISILVVASILLFFAFREDNKESQSTTEPWETETKKSSIKSQVSFCINDAGASSIYFISQYGGTFPPKEPQFRGIPYYSYENRLTLPEISTIESDLGDYFEGAFMNCMSESNFSGEIPDKKDVKAKTKIFDDRVDFDVTYPINITEKGQARILEDFSSSIPIKLGEIYKISKFIANQHVGDNRQNLCLTCLERETSGTGLDIQSFSGPQNNSELYVIIDERAIGAREIPVSEDEPLRYMLGVKY